MIPDDVLRAVDYAVLGVSGAHMHRAAALVAPRVRVKLCCLSRQGGIVAEA